jgi:hypothetical protein
MARGVLANQAGRNQNLRGSEGRLLASDIEPALFSASPSLYASESLGATRSLLRTAMLSGTSCLYIHSWLARQCISLLLFVAIVLKSDGLSIEVAAARSIVPWKLFVTAIIPSELFLADIFGRKGMALNQLGMTDLANGVVLLKSENWDAHPGASGFVDNMSACFWLDSNATNCDSEMYRSEQVRRSPLS